MIKDFNVERILKKKMMLDGNFLEDINEEEQTLSTKDVNEIKKYLIDIYDYIKQLNKKIDNLEKNYK